MDNLVQSFSNVNVMTVQVISVQVISGIGIPVVSSCRTDPTGVGGVAGDQVEFSFPARPLLFL